jgi:hypothetical protein
MLVTADDGNTKVVRKRDARDYCCSICGIKEVTRWRRLYDSVQCKVSLFAIINLVLILFIVIVR